MTQFFRPSSRYWSVVASVVSCAFMGLLMSPGAVAEGEATAPTNTNTAAVTPYTVPNVPSFAPVNLGAYNGILSDCAGQSLGSVAAACGTLTEYDADVDLSCEILTPEYLASSALKVSGAIGAQNCKKTQLAMARGKIDCVARGASLLQAMIGQQRAQFEREIQFTQSSLRQLTQIRKGFEQQNEFIGKRLNGDRGENGSGAMGLIEAQEVIEKSLQEMTGGGERGSGTIAAFKEVNRGIEDKKKFLLETVQQRTIDLTTECVKNGGNQGKRYQCVPNGPDVSYLAYLTCQYDRSFSIGEDGRIEKDDVLRKRGATRAASLAGALEQMNLAIPEAMRPPVNQIDRYYSNTNSLWFSFDDFRSGIRSRLSQFDTANFQVSEKILKKAESCFGSAKQQVAKERRGASNRSQRETGKQGGSEARGLVDLQEDIKTNEEAQQAAARKFFLSANKTYADSVKPLLGRNVTLSLDACTNAKPAVQANCMDQISKSFEDLYLGKSDLSKVNMVVPGNGAVRDLVIQCMGLKGCTADLQAQHDYLKNTVKQVDQSKQKFAAEANQKIDSMRTSLARAVAFPNQLLIQQQDELNRFLAGLGVSGSISLEDIEGKAFEKDDDEDLKPLYKNPVGDEFIQGISAGSTPPLKKVGKDSFNEAYKGIAEGVKQADEKIAKLNSLQDKMFGAMSKCQKQEAEKKAEEQKKKDQEAAESQKFDNERNQMALDSMVDDANDIAQCGHVSGWCNSAKKNEIQRLLSSVQQLDSKSGNKLDTSDIEGFLQTAISGSSCREGKRLDDGDLSGMGRDCKSRVDSKITEMKSRLSRRSSSGSSSSSSAR